MSGGHNTDLRLGGRVFHVQSEDRGPQAALLETRVYEGGEILHTTCESYAELGTRANLDDLRRQRLAAQHHAVLERLRLGELALEGADRGPGGESEKSK